MKRILTVLTLVVVMLALPMSAVYASEPTFVDGYAGLTDYWVIDAKPAGKSDNAVLTLGVINQWAGSIEGIETGTSTVTYVVHNWNAALFAAVPESLGFDLDTRFNTYSIITFSNVTVTVEGEKYTGGLTIKMNCAGSAIGGGMGYWVILSGSDKLENLKGNGKMYMEGPPPNYFDGQVHFAPYAPDPD